jgi:hypothetical protein
MPARQASDIISVAVESASLLTSAVDFAFPPAWGTLEEEIEACESSVPDVYCSFISALLPPGAAPASPTSAALIPPSAANNTAPPQTVKAATRTAATSSRNPPPRKSLKIPNFISSSLQAQPTPCNKNDKPQM